MKGDDENRYTQAALEADRERRRGVIADMTLREDIYFPMAEKGYERDFRFWSWQ